MEIINVIIKVKAEFYSIYNGYQEINDRLYIMKLIKEVFLTYLINVAIKIVNVKIF